MILIAIPLSHGQAGRVLSAAGAVPPHRRQSLACELMLAAQDIEAEAPALAETLMTIRSLLLDCGEGGAA